ncbi:ABC transporter substrate-binding protein [uncultured Cohaesibacter sp.]|uniref:ABC transporter substrate-binding protein n=1 Tax=uncultured Cohaesibacter sp. TaxID=1002546 RepID=UPI00292DBAB6|nr:ABC transporter substrate-binding protein [uncultured Cohaesibacter sp.]
MNIKSQTRQFAVIAAVSLISSLSFSSSWAEETHYPVTIENCGYKTTFDAAPTHAVTLSNNATELMLALGLEDHMAGTSYMANLTISPEYAGAYKKVPILSPLVATTEQLIDAEADFVYAGYPDGFSKKRHSREQLQDLGMKTHLNTEGCNLGKYGFEQLYAEIRTIAKIFNVNDRGEALIEKLSARVAGVEEKLKDVEAIPVFIFNGGESAPRAVLGNTMHSTVVQLAKGENIFGDMPNRYGTVSWEQIAERNPTFIDVFYSGTASGKVVDNPTRDLGDVRISILKSNPAIADTTAVKQDNFVTIDSVMGQPGPSSVRALERLAKAFHPEAFE